jgi:Tfp pilus assembly protein PilX
VNPHTIPSPTTHTRRALRASARRGLALIISLFVLLAISGIGLIAMQTATIELRVTGNYRLDKQAHFVTESGLMAAMGVISQSGDGFWTLMKRAHRENPNAAAASPEMSMTQSDFTTLFNNPAADTTTLTPRFTVRVHTPLDGMRATGYSEDFCFKRLTFDSTGAVGDDASTAQIQDQFIRASTRAFRAEALMGPMECEGN